MRNPLWWENKQCDTHQVTGSLSSAVALLGAVSPSASWPWYCFLVLQRKHIAMRSPLIWHSVLQRADVPQTDQMSFVVCRNIEHHNLRDIAEQRVRCTTSCCSMITFRVMNGSSQELWGTGKRRWGFIEAVHGTTSLEGVSFTPFCCVVYCKRPTFSYLSYVLQLYILFLFLWYKHCCVQWWKKYSDLLLQ